MLRKPCAGLKNLVMLKLIYAVCMMLFCCTIAQSQQKELTPGEFAIYKGLELRSVKYVTDEAKINDRIKEIQEFVAAQDTLKSLHFARAYNYLATLKSYLGTEPDSVSHYAKISFESHPEWFCKEVVPWQEKSENPDLESVILPYYLGAQEEKLYGLMRKFCKQEGWLVEAPKPVEKAANEEYLDALLAIEARSKKERKVFEEVDWDVQNKLDAQNREALDALYDKYGFPDRQQVTHDGLVMAFMVLHNSLDCEWNKKWIPRFMEHIQEFDSPGIVSYMFERNFDKSAGHCKEELAFVEKLVEDLEPAVVDKMNLTDFLD